MVSHVGESIVVSRFFHVHDDIFCIIKHVQVGINVETEVCFNPFFDVGYRVFVGRLYSVGDEVVDVDDLTIIATMFTFVVSS